MENRVCLRRIVAGLSPPRSGFDPR